VTRSATVMTKVAAGVTEAAVAVTRSAGVVTRSIKFVTEVVINVTGPHKIVSAAAARIRKVVLFDELPRMIRPDGHP
jgi:hypothetical protein